MRYEKKTQEFIDISRINLDENKKNFKFFTVYYDRNLKTFENDKKIYIIDILRDEMYSIEK